MTLKQGQGHQTRVVLADPKQGINHAKFERPPLNSAEKPTLNLKVTVKPENLSIISPKYHVQKWKVEYVIYTILYVT